MELNKVIHDIQKNIKAPKGQYNKFGGYHYRNCEDILEAIKPMLPEGCFINISDTIKEIGGRVYVESTATIWNDKTSYSSTAFAREPLEKKGMDASQITGSTSSYARKYALNGLFCIDDTKDADSDEKEAPKKTEQEIKPLSGDEFIALQTEIREATSHEELNIARDKAQSARARMTKEQQKTIGNEVKKRVDVLSPKTIDPNEPIKGISGNA